MLKQWRRGSNISVYTLTPTHD